LHHYFYLPFRKAAYIRDRPLSWGRGSGRNALFEEPDRPYQSGPIGRRFAYNPMLAFPYFYVNIETSGRKVDAGESAAAIPFRT
jgi:hypothetical protein